MSDEEVRHGVEGGAYDNIMGSMLGRPAPFLFCLCGFQTVHGGNDNWEEAGAEFDEHLASVRP